MPPYAHLVKLHGSHVARTGHYKVTATGRPCASCHLQATASLTLKHLHLCSWYSLLIARQRSIRHNLAFGIKQQKAGSSCCCAPPEQAHAGVCL